MSSQYHMPVLRTKPSSSDITLNLSQNTTANITLTFPALHMNNNVTIYNLDGSVNSEFTVTFPIEITMEDVTFSKITLNDSQFNYEVFYTLQLNNYQTNAEYQSAISQSYMNVTTIPYTAPPVFAFGSISYGNLPSPYAYSMAMTIQNQNSVNPTGTGFPIIFNYTPSSSDQSLFASGFTNVAFFSDSGLTQELQSSVLSSSSNTEATFGINIPNINPSSNITIYMGIASTTSNVNPANFTNVPFSTNYYDLIEGANALLDFSVSNDNSIVVCMVVIGADTDATATFPSGMNVISTGISGDNNSVGWLAYGVLNSGSYSITTSSDTSAVSLLAYYVFDSFNSDFFTVNTDYKNQYFNGGNSGSQTLTLPNNPYPYSPIIVNFDGSTSTSSGLPNVIYQTLSSNSEYIGLGYTTAVPPEDSNSVTISGTFYGMNTSTFSLTMNDISISTGSINPSLATITIYPTNTGLLYFKGQVYNTGSSAVTFSIDNPDGSTAYSLEVPADSPPETFEFYSPNWEINFQYVFTFTNNVTFNYFLCRETY